MKKSQQRWLDRRQQPGAHWLQQPGGPSLKRPQQLATAAAAATAAGLLGNIVGLQQIE